MPVYLFHCLSRLYLQKHPCLWHYHLLIYADSADRQHYRRYEFPADVTWRLNSETVWQSIIQTPRSLSHWSLCALMDTFNTGAASYWNSPFIYSRVNRGTGTASLLISVVYLWKGTQVQQQPEHLVDALRMRKPSTSLSLTFLYNILTACKVLGYGTHQILLTQPVKLLKLLRH